MSLQRRNFKLCLTACSRALSNRSFCILVFSVILCGLSGFCDANVSSKISCDDDEMRVEVKGSNITEAYLLGLKNYPEASCQPDRVSSDLLKFRLSLRDFYRCGTAQILNKITGSKTFYNRIVVVAGGQDQEIMVKCSQEGVLPHPVGNNFINATMRRRRDVLPAGFVEQDARYVKDVVNSTAEPILGMVVKQDGRIIGNELLVSPGSPLTMEVTLDPRSSPLYGIIVSQLYVTDDEDQTEVILTNGCSVDPYLFENFVTRDGDLLSAKFRAFKFPESNFVRFIGTVNVCLGICQPSDCRNGQIGYGRRRRSIEMDRLNGLYEAQMTIFVRIKDEDPNDPEQMAAVLRSTRQVRNEGQLKRDTSFQADYVQQVSTSGGQSLAKSTTAASLLVTIPFGFLLGIWLNRNVGSC